MSRMDDRPIRVLLVEDNPGDARLIREALKDAEAIDSAGPTFQLVRAERLADALARVADSDVDVVLLDLSLPDSHGFETFARAQARASGVPIVVLSGLDDRALAVRSVREGAQDYLVKGQVDGGVLARSLRYAVERRQAEEERARRIREQAARTEAEAIARRATFLAEAGSLLAESLDYETTLASVATLAVPFLADWCIVDVDEADDDDGGAIRRLAVAHADEAKAHLARELQRHAPDRAGANPIPRALRTGRSELIPEISEPIMAAIVGDAEHLQFIRGLGFSSAMIVPLTARGRILGTMTFVAAESGRRYGPTDLHLAEDLVCRCALAVDNARLYRRAQEATRTREAERDRLQQVLDVLPEAIALIDADGQIVLRNAAALAIWGRPGDRGPGSGGDRYDQITIYRLDGVPWPADETPLARSVRHGEVVRGRQMLLREARSGRDVPVLVSSAPLRDGAGTIVGGVAVFQDISSIKELERQKDEFLTAASHDLKTPLATIKGWTQLLRRQAQRPDKVDSARLLDGLGRIDLTISRLTRMVNDLLDVTRMQMERPLDLDRRPTDLVALTTRMAAESQLTTERHRIRIDSADPSLRGRWDTARVERAVGQLLGNAIKYSPEGGEIVVQVAREENGQGAFARLEVRDSGVGIPADELGRVFDRFYRGSNVPEGMSGTGIGLTGARQIVQEHGGQISVESREGQGSIFTIRLPLDE